MKPKFSTFNDGVLYICDSTKADTTFGAVQNVTAASELNRLYKLDFAEMSKRDQDMDFAESQGHALSLKVKTRLISISKMNKVLIENRLYTIIHLDEDRNNGLMYLYLEEERQF